MMNLRNLAGFTLLLAVLAAVLYALPGCVSLEAPKTFTDRLAYGYASVAASRDNAVGMLERKRITKEQATEIQRIADQARAALDLARSASGRGDVQTADGQLNLALSVLTALEARLKAMEAK